MRSTAFGVPLAMMIAALTLACSGGDETSGAGQGTGPVPQALVGSWYSGTHDGLAAYDPATGAWGTPPGDGTVYVFASDARYTRAFQSYHEHPKCTIGATAFEEGTLIVDADTIVTEPVEARLELIDTCAPITSGTKPVTPLRSKTLEWRLDPSSGDGAPTVLRLRQPYGEESEFVPL